MTPRITRLCIVAAVVWACSCGVKGPVPWWVASQAQASQGLQAYADALCIGLRNAYSNTVPGWKVVFKACRPADYDPVVGVQHYWVWYRVVHRHRVMLAICKIGPDGSPVEEPVVLSPYQYDHLMKPAPKAYR